MSTETESIVARLKKSGLLQTKGLIGGKWTDAYGGRTIEVLSFYSFKFLCYIHYDMFKTLA